MDWAYVSLGQTRFFAFNVTLISFQLSVNGALEQGQLWMDAAAYILPTGFTKTGRIYRFAGQSSNACMHHSHKNVDGDDDDYDDDD